MCVSERVPCVSTHACALERAGPSYVRAGVRACVRACVRRI